MINYEYMYRAKKRDHEKMNEKSEFNKSVVQNSCIFAKYRSKFFDCGCLPFSCKHITSNAEPNNWESPKNANP